jgi:HEAT repeat protein
METGKVDQTFTMHYTQLSPLSGSDMSHTIEEQGIADLIRALNDRPWQTRRQAADALIKLGEPAVVPLMTAIRQNAFTVFTLPEAVRALGGIGAIQAVDLLIEELESWNVHAVQEAAKGLGHIGSPQAIQPLIDMFRHDWEDTETITAWQEAATALAAIGEPALPALLTALSDEDDNVRQGVAEALGQLHDPRTVGPLVKALQDETSIVRAYVADALAKLGDKRAIEPLIALLTDEDWYVRAHVLSALGQLGGPSVFAPLVSALDDQEPWVRSAAVYGLGKLQDARIQNILLEALKDSDGRVRSAAALTLGKIGDERALPALTWVQQNDSGYSGANKVKDYATYAIQGIQERHQKS